MAAQSVDSNDIDIRIWHLVERKETILLLGRLAKIRSPKVVAGQMAPHLYQGGGGGGGFGFSALKEFHDSGLYI